MTKEQKDIINQFVDNHGSDLNRLLTRHYKQYGIGLPYNTLFPRYAIRCKKLGISLNDFVDMVEKAKYVKIVLTIHGRKYVLAGNCEMTDDEIQEWFQSEQDNREMNQELKKSARKQIENIG